MTPESLLTTTAITGAAIGLVAAFWSKIKMLAWRVLSLFVVRIVVRGDAAAAVSEYLWSDFRRSKYGERSYGGAGMFVRPVGRILSVAWERIGLDFTVFWQGWRPIGAQFVSDEPNSQNAAAYRLTLTFIRGVFDPDQLVEVAVAKMNERRHGNGKERFRIERMIGRRCRLANGRNSAYGSSGPGPAEPQFVTHYGIDDWAGKRLLTWKQEEVGPPSPPDPLGPLAFPPEVYVLVEECRCWRASERWYKDRRIPWRLGWLLYGPPGTGKTSLARAVAAECDLVVCVMELATMTDEDLITFWKDAMKSSPCMILLEDIDSVFNGRENVTGDESGLSFGCLLNCISGVEGSDGVLVVATTNRLDHVDPALGKPDESGRSTRPGRLDRAVELRHMDADCRRKVAQRILADCLHEVERVVAEGEGETGAQFQDRCAKVALAHHWNAQEAKRS